MSTGTIGPDWRSLTEAAQEAIVTARTALDELARAWEAATSSDLDAAGLLARPLPSRDEIAEVIEVEILVFFDWPGLHPDLPYAVADAVLALLEGADG